jgi:FAD/FMN-containing dehydrogenase
MIDRRPAVIVRAADVADVMSAVHFAREQHLRIAVRGGGHSVPGFGTCDGGLVLDLGRMRGTRVDPERRTLRAEGGCTWGDVNHAAHAFGLGTTGGLISTTGIAGLTLGGGIGYLSRMCGLSCDNLISADVVTADGRLLTCSEEREKDLFWGLRGGGGNFGVVTSFEYRLHPVGEIYGGPVFFPLEAGPFRGYREWLRAAPESMGAAFGVTLAPSLPFLPETWHGKPVSAVIACWVGPPEEGEALLKPLKGWAEVLGSYLGAMPYPAINTLFDTLLPKGMQNYWKTCAARELTDAAIAAHLEHGAKTPTIESSAFLLPIDGACHRLPPEATAFPARDARFVTLVSGAWWDPADNDRNIRWVRDYYEALRPHSQDAGYVNFMSGDDQGKVRANYGRNYDRLVEVKDQYDPTNLFRLNQNVAPTRVTAA